jgi:hypothetical protein
MCENWEILQFCQKRILVFESPAQNHKDGNPGMLNHINFQGNYLWEKL